MPGYHVNPKTGNPGACTAVRGGCPFGGDDDHYTSLTAARTAYELSHPTFSAIRRGASDFLDLQAIHQTADYTLETAELFTGHSDHEPTGSVVIKVNSLTQERDYLVKDEAGKWRPLWIQKASISLSPLSHSALAMEHRGVSSYYFSKPATYLRDSIENSLNYRADVASKVARLMHSTWREGRKLDDGSYKPSLRTDKNGVVTDVASVTYGLLPAVWQLENQLSANSALTSISESIQYGGLEDTHVPEEIYKAWLERNDPNAEAAVSYAELSQFEQAKDVVVLSKVLEVVSRDY